MHVMALHLYAKWLRIVMQVGSFLLDMDPRNGTQIVSLSRADFSFQAISHLQPILKGKQNGGWKTTQYSYSIAQCLHLLYRPKNYQLFVFSVLLFGWVVLAQFCFPITFMPQNNFSFFMNTIPCFFWFSITFCAVVPKLTLTFPLYQFASPFCPYSYNPQEFVS